MQEIEDARDISASSEEDEVMLGAEVGLEVGLTEGELVGGFVEFVGGVVGDWVELLGDGVLVGDLVGNLWVD